MKKYVYSIGYHSYEESEYVQLYHKNKFSNKAFRKIVIKAVINLLKKWKIEKGGGITFQNIFFSVIDELIKEFHFEKLEFTARFDIFGWADILNEKDWEGVRDKELNELTNEIKKQINYQKSKGKKVIKNNNKKKAVR
ncbi:hypothetical protein HYX16_03210 [Candidatus Woesearchaeota archaeon]|nr:hypothetical protein [Candidatus Woesearchaeota archaeon]